MLATRNYMRTKKGIYTPNIVLPNTAHPAFFKACHYYNIEPRSIDIDKTTMKGRVDLMKKAIDKNTIGLVGSCPTFPHGVIDDIVALSKLAVSKKIGLHVDCCLGGFIVPFMKECGVELPPFDFRLPGVTSISCDHHKYGMAPKGVSIIMFKELDMLHGAHFTKSDWSGGLYATPTPAGSRCAAPSVGAWFCMQYFGREKYKEFSKIISGAV
mmetsp:Transcript_110717/g.155417  ORF Transcript_110717/g.155417 Transcript_110717/m.155417 type:complete len:212 (+) Transcript_110717:524-1159(+)